MKQDIRSSTQPVALCILDGWGLRNEPSFNAPVLANTPNFDYLMQNCPNATLITHGEAVGLQAGTIGNSEVGHIHIGAGRIVPMDMKRIDDAIHTGLFAKNPKISNFARNAQLNSKFIHLIGIVSDVGVHGLGRHMLAAVRKFDAYNLQIKLHVITDGRDTSPGQALQQIEAIESQLPPNAAIATVIGRYFAMDRDKRWERVEKAYQAIVSGQGFKAATSYEAIENSLTRGESDEFISPSIIGNYAGMTEGDSIFFTNYRSDRMRQITNAICNPDFDAFEISSRTRNLVAIGMVNYFDPQVNWIECIFSKQRIENGLGEWVSRCNRSQFRLAETEKYPHVTYFFNGGRESPFPLEDRYMAQSPKVPTYDRAPEMAAAEVALHFSKAVESGYDMIVTNFANPDMVGHTGDLDAAIKACQATDEGLGIVMKAIKKHGGRMIVTADHGNCEQMYDPVNDCPHTAHTTNPVPVLLFGNHFEYRLRSGQLCDLAPTILELMNLNVPDVMTGNSLLD